MFKCHFESACVITWNGNINWVHFLHILCGWARHIWYICNCFGAHQNAVRAMLGPTRKEGHRHTNSYPNSWAFVFLCAEMKRGYICFDLPTMFKYDVCNSACVLDPLLSQTRLDAFAPSPQLSADSAVIWLGEPSSLLLSVSSFGARWLL